ALLFCLIAFAFPLYAQNNKATIVGTVKDPSNAIVVGAKVTATNLATSEMSEPVTTDNDGTYTIPNLVPGNYRVTVEQTGFKTYVQEPIVVETNARVPIDVQLTLGTLGGETVTVTSEGPVVESETSVRGDLITGRQVTDLPIAQRNFTLLAALSPGVTRPAVGVIGGGGNFEQGSPVGTSTESTRFRESGGSVLVVNGARPTNNNFTLDGVDNNEGQFGQIATFPPPDAIAEFKIETSVPQAESGRAGGAIISATTKSGGNKVHGDVYEFYQGRFASALSAQFKTPGTFVSNKVTHQFGGVVGGPVLLPRFGEGGPDIWNGRNRTFFFVNYEGQRNSTPSTTNDFPFVTVPTVKMRAGNFSELFGTGTQEFPFALGYTNPTGASCRINPSNSQ
ncbi:MAG TPA: carboxypeptidase-like regulatory domain-containing protein, partial [Pyrinomonadaceae bacterium]|nr:carboxypeptidase-like regulatory domain-containing protein [Pyrinomonadaceae bacterium]